MTAAQQKASKPEVLYNAETKPRRGNISIGLGNDNSHKKATREMKNPSTMKSLAPVEGSDIAVSKYQL
jgi:hypothetical protein